MFVSTNQLIYSLVVNFLPRWQLSFTTERSKVGAGQEFLHRLKIGHLFTSDLALNQFTYELREALAATCRFDAGAGRNGIVQSYRDVLHRVDPKTQISCFGVSVSSTRLIQASAQPAPARHQNPSPASRGVLCSGNLNPRP